MMAIKRKLGNEKQRARTVSQSSTTPLLSYRATFKIHSSPCFFEQNELKSTRPLANETKIDFFHHKKWPLHLLTTMTFLLPLFSSGTRSATLFFGENCVLEQSIRFALELASSCQHPDAHWLIEACAGKDINTDGDAHRVFSALGQNDARALCFTWLLRWGDLAPLRLSAELGFAFAQFLLARRTQGEEKFKFAWLAAAQGERDGFNELGVCLRDGKGCEKNLDKAKENFLIASELGDVLAMLDLGDLLDESDPQQWQWWDVRQVLEKARGFCPTLRIKSNCSMLAQEMLLSCLRLDKLCKGM
jgi:hypothetical protein